MQTFHQLRIKHQVFSLTATLKEASEGHVPNEEEPDIYRESSHENKLS